MTAPPLEMTDHLSSGHWSVEDGMRNQVISEHGAINGLAITKLQICLPKRTCPSVAYCPLGNELLFT